MAVIILSFLFLGLYPKLYPELAQYMGLSLSEDEIHKNMSMVPSAGVSKSYWALFVSV